MPDQPPPTPPGWAPPSPSPSTPPQGWGPPGQGPQGQAPGQGPQGWGPPGVPPTLPPGAKPSSPGKAIAIILGVIGVTFVAVVGLLVGAVTFLGRSAEPRFTPVGSSVPMGDGGEDGPFTVVTPPDDPSDDPYQGRYEDPYEDPSAGGFDPSALVLSTVTEVLAAGDWMLTDEYLMGPDERVESAPCAPGGWQTGAQDRAIGMFGAPDADETDALTVTLVTYSTEQAAAAEVGRASSSEYQRCEVTQRQQRGRLGDEVEVTVLPEVPTAPGVAIAMAEPGGRTEVDQIIVVGRMRAQLDVCDCAGLDLATLELVAADVAAAMADEQGLPVPE